MLRALSSVDCASFNACRAASSASAATLAYWISDQFYEGAQIWEKELSTKKFLNELKILFGGSILNLDYLVDYLMKEKIPLDVEAIKNSSIEFIVTATEFETAKPVTFSNRQKIDLLKAIKASMALPIAYRKAVEINGKRYIDGGLTQPIPIEAVKDKANKFLVISTKPPKYKKSSFWFKTEMNKLPEKIKELMNEREKYHEKCWSLVYELSRKKEVVIVRPSRELPLGKFDNSREKILETIEQGKKDAREKKDLIEKLV